MEKQNTINLSFKLILWMMLGWGLGNLMMKYQPQWLDWLEKAQIKPIKLNIPVSILIFLLIFFWAIQMDIKRIKDSMKEPIYFLLLPLIQVILKPLLIYLLHALWFYFVLIRWQEPKTLSTYLLVFTIIGSSTSGIILSDYLNQEKNLDESKNDQLQILFNSILLGLFFVPLLKVFHLLNERSIVDPLLKGNGRMKGPSTIQLYLSIGIYVILPILLAIGLRFFVEKRKGRPFVLNKLVPVFNSIRAICYIVLFTFIFGMDHAITFIDLMTIGFVIVPLLISWLILFFITFLIARNKRITIKTPFILSASSFFFEFTLGVVILFVGLKHVILFVPVFALLLEVILIVIFNRIVDRFSSK